MSKNNTQCVRRCLRRSVGCGWYPWLNAWLTSSSSSTRVCHALANLSNPSRPPAAFVDCLDVPGVFRTNGDNENRNCDDARKSKA